jgi:hypothetical protein
MVESHRSIVRSACRAFPVLLKTGLERSASSSGGARGRLAWAAARAPTVHLFEDLDQKAGSSIALLGQKQLSLAALIFCPGSNSELAPPLASRLARTSSSMLHARTQARSND